MSGSKAISADVAFIPLFFFCSKLMLKLTLNAHYVFGKEVILFILKPYRAKTQIRKIDWEKRTPLLWPLQQSSQHVNLFNQSTDGSSHSPFIPVLNKSGIGDWKDKTLSLDIFIYWYGFSSFWAYLGTFFRKLWSSNPRQPVCCCRKWYDVTKRLNT